jgi:hypothetical protein
MCSSGTPAEWCGPAALLIAVLVAGCHGHDHDTGRVSGRVLLNGAPLPGGRVTFMPVDGRNPVMAILSEDGTYPPVELPVGEVLVRVDNRELQQIVAPRSFTPPARDLKNALVKMGKGGQIPVPPSPKPSIPGHYVKIDPKYHNTDTSGLGFRVEPGEFTHDILLSSK